MTLQLDGVCRAPLVCWTFQAAARLLRARLYKLTVRCELRARRSNRPPLFRQPVSARRHGHVAEDRRTTGPKSRLLSPHSQLSGERSTGHVPLFADDRGSDCGDCVAPLLACSGAEIEPLKAVSPSRQSPPALMSDDRELRTVSGRSQFVSLLVTVCLPE